jgi:acetyl esterase/lipase
MKTMKALPLFLAAAVVAAVALPLAVCAAPISFSDLLGRPRPAADARIAYGSGPEQFGELFLPAGKKPHRVIVMIHGGCWLQSLPGVELMDQISAALKARGFAVWNIDYRRVGGTGGYPATFLDVANAVDYLRNIAPKYHLDLRKVVAVGHSAGGQLAVWAAARPKLPKSSELYRANPLPIAGVVSLAGIDDLEAYRANGPDACGGPATIDSLVGPPTATHPDVYADTSPAELLPIGVPQRIISGSLDKIVPTVFAVDYTKKAKATGDDATTEEMPGAGHFEQIDPTSDAWKKIEPMIERLSK